MRKALVYCQEKQKSLEDMDVVNAWLPPEVTGKKEQLETFLDAQRRARAMPSMRDNQIELSNIDVLDEMPTPFEFRQRYTLANRPCCIRDREWCELHFNRVLANWRKERHTSSNNNLNRSWFEEHVGRDTLVPVRYQPIHPKDVNHRCNPGEVDSEGRAMECETMNMTFSAWLGILDQSASESKATESNYACYYLKDWHLCLSIEQRFPNDPRLYKVPEHFEHDLLNQFLTLFTSGDYRFTYWGPNGSKTTLHSDVLNSFSWSLNVHGTKEWTFYLPSDQGSSIDATSGSHSRTIVVRQQVGDCIFVPAGWKHHVTNIGETLSVNHNWITTANLDLTWDCIVSEMNSVEKELEAWEKSSDTIFDWEARESMLRGCVGLDVTAFYLMVLVGALRVLYDENENSICLWEKYFDLVRLTDMLKLLHSDSSIHLKERLQATLADAYLQADALAVAKKVILLTEKLYH